MKPGKQVERSVQLAVLLLLVSAVVLSIQASSAPRTGFVGLDVTSDTTSDSAGSRTARLAVGLNSHPNVGGGPRAARLLGTGLSRVEWDIRTPPRLMEGIVKAYARVGVQIQPLAGFAGRVPSYSEARNLRAWALRFGPRSSFWRTPASRRLAVTHIEFGNETSYGYQYGDDSDSDTYAQRARVYAERAYDAARALRGTGVGLLVQADDGGSRRSTWVEQMLSTVPDLPSLTSGWVVHPYGPSGSERIKRTIAHLGENGVPLASIRIYVTEWGLATGDGKRLDDNYGYEPDMTYERAAEVLRSTVAGWRRDFGAMLTQVILFQDYEPQNPGDSRNREDHFGILRTSGATKGPYTAEVRRQLAAEDRP